MGIQTTPVSSLGVYDSLSSSAGSRGDRQASRGVIAMSHAAWTCEEEEEENERNGQTLAGGVVVGNKAKAVTGALAVLLMSRPEV